MAATKKASAKRRGVGAPKRKGPGRPPGTGKFQPDLIEKILKLVRNGNYLTVATSACGISVAAVQAWKRRGMDAMEAQAEGTKLPVHERKYVDFVIAYEKARAECEDELVERIKHAGMFGNQWQANAWLLERTRPQRYGRRAVIEHTGEVTKEISITIVTTGAVDEGTTAPILELPLTNGHANGQGPGH